MLPANKRHFVFLQGPHGPYFDQLSKMLRTTGARTSRIGFNAGDAAFWRDRDSYLSFSDPLHEWPARFSEIVEDLGITDLVLYGDTRPVHAQAIKIAKSVGLTVHVFEEGYLRPYWITYERDGANGNSRLMDISVAEMQESLDGARTDLAEAPDHWGDMREHMFYGALYHWHVLFRNQRYKNFQSHRNISVALEFRLHLQRLLLMPTHFVGRVRATRRIKSGGFPYHLGLLQLEHDASFRDHSPLDSMETFLRLTIEAFAQGAPSHHHLVLKAHPLEDGRVPIQATIAKLADEHDIASRVHFVRGGKLAQLLDGAKTAVTVNSTSAQQALWRGLPLRAFGKAIFCKPEFVSEQPLVQFFANPTSPDLELYRDYRRFLLQTSQVPGGYYASRSRRQVLRLVVDMMLRTNGPYDAENTQSAAHTQQLALVSNP